MYRRRAFVHSIVVVLLAAQLTFAAKKPEPTNLATRIDDILSEPDVLRGFWGVEVVSLNSGKTLYTRNADKLFTPASNTKLFTTSAAMALIGPDYRFHTTVETAGTIDKYGRRTRYLVLVGPRSPHLSGRTLPYHLPPERQ